MSMLINNEYSTSLSIKEISSKNAFYARSTGDFLVLLVRNLYVENGTQEYSNNYIHLKCNNTLLINNSLIGNFHILSCIVNEEQVNKDFQRITKTIFIDENKGMSSSDIILLFYSLQNIFTQSLSKESKLLQIGVFGEYVSLIKLYNVGLSDIVDCWHNDFSSRHDIEINKSTRIEIKTTSKGERIHRFSHNQISRPNQKIFVISNVIELSEEGVTLFDLSMLVSDIMKDYKKRLLIEQLNKMCGVSEFNKGVTSNLEDCLSKCKLYEDCNVPKLEISNTKGISNISYDVDFSFAEDLAFNNLQNV